MTDEPVVKAKVGIEIHKVGPKSLYSAERIALGNTPGSVPYTVEVRGDPPQAIVVMLNGNIAQRYEYRIIDLVEAAVDYRARETESAAPSHERVAPA